ncbi:MAG: hypothetical protein V1678_02270 [Candidatus Aenigmatarchaeota archaeon]
MKKTVVFDMHGLIYSYSPDFDNERSIDALDAAVRSHPDLTEQKAENESVSMWIAGDSSELVAYEIPGALGRVFEYVRKAYRIVFASSSDADTTKKILRFIIGRRGIDLDVNSFEIRSFEGSKKEPREWVKALRGCENITDIYDDNPEYLKAAFEAAKALGSSPRLHASVKD